GGELQMSSAASWSLLGMLIVFILFCSWVLMRLAAISDEEARMARAQRILDEAWDEFEDRQERHQEVEYRAAERPDWEQGMDFLYWNREVKLVEQRLLDELTDPNHEDRP